MLYFVFTFKISVDIDGKCHRVNKIIIHFLFLLFFCFVLSCLYLVVNIIISIMSTTRFIWPVNIYDQKENIFFVGEIQVQVHRPVQYACVIIRKRTSFIK